MDDKMQIAKGRLALHAGFWLGLGSKMEWKPGQAQGGVAMTDGRNVIYNLENINARPIGDVVFIALHEIGHPMLCHLTRRGNRDPIIYGAAIDIVLNDLLAKIMQESPRLGMTLPPDACVAAKFNMPDTVPMQVEPVYNWLLSECEKQGGGDKGKQKMGIGIFDEHGDPKDADGKPADAKAIEALEKEWKLSLQAAAIMAKKMGKLPGFMEEFITEVLKPKVDWRTQLRNCVSRIAKDESSYRRFNRRHLSRRIYLPGYYSERLNSIAYACDTSGSVTTEEFKQGKGEMEAILEDMKPDKIFFLQCDTRLHDVQELTPDDLPLPALRMVGRGGTDMNPVFAWACEHEEEIEVLVMQTDGEIGPIEAHNIPNIPVIWIVTRDRELPVDFGTIVRVVL